MKSSILLFLIFITANLCAAQTAKRTITNDDLEKYKQSRLKADADYRANYERLGMPSPEEIEQLEAKRKAQLAEDADRARAVQYQEYEAQLRTSELQNQRALVNAQINYLRSQTGNSYYPQQSSVFVGGQILNPSVYGGGFYYGNGYNFQRRGGYRQNTLLPSNIQLVRNAANSFPTPTDIRNQIYGIPPRTVAPRGNFGRRH